MPPLQKLANETALYGLSSVIGRLLNYLLVPFYTSIFSPADYGLVTELYAYAAFLQILYTYGMETAYFRFAKQEPAAFDLAMSALLTSSLVLSSLLVLFAKPIIEMLGHPGCERYVYYFAAILAIDAVLIIPFARLRLQRRAFWFASTKVSQISLTIVLNLVLLSVCANIYTGNGWIALQPWVARFYNPSRNVDYVLLANLVGNAIAFPLLSKSLRQIKLQLSWRHLGPMLVYALPLLLMGLASTINEMLSRAMLRHWLPVGFYPGQSNETVLGIFGACYKLAVFMPLCTQAFRYAAEPFFFAQAQAPNAPALFSTVMHWFTLGACFVLFAVSANLDWLALLLLRQAEYRAALEIVPYLLLGYLFRGMYFNLAVWFKLTDKTHYGTYLSSIGALVTIVLNIILIPKVGYWGSIWAFLVSHITMNLFSYYWGQKHYPIPYQAGQKLAYILVTMGSVYLVRKIAYDTTRHAVMVNLVFTLLFGWLLYGIGCFQRPRAGVRKEPKRRLTRR